MDSLALMPAETCLLDLRFEAVIEEDSGSIMEKEIVAARREPDGRSSWELTGEWPVETQGLELVEV